MIDLGSKGGKFETHRMHCDVSLSKTLYPLLIIGSTKEGKKSPNMNKKLLTEV